LFRVIVRSSPRILRFARNKYSLLLGSVSVSNAGKFGLFIQREVGPADRFAFDGAPGTFGVITPVSEPFRVSLVKPAAGITLLEESRNRTMRQFATWSLESASLHTLLKIRQR
jgi:hypothetical protein